MTVQYPLWLPILAAVAFVILAFAVITLIVCHVRDGRRIARTQWISAHLPRRARTEGVADAALRDLTGGGR